MVVTSQFSYSSRSQPSILGSAETYLVITRMLGWDLDEYENWLVTTSARLSSPA